MKVSIASREKMKQLISSVMYYGTLKSDTYIISYYSDLRDLNFSKVRSKVFKAKIDDIRVVKNKEKFYEDNYKVFLDMAHFIQEAKDNDCDIYCQCEAGVSRSAGTAMAIRDYYFNDGDVILKDWHYMPNYLLYYCVIRALNEINGTDIWPDKIR
ncbi:MAG: dual specificity protein phosphatase family protein [Erysipelotrichaceae bacterium]|nr:dual specificity protein phosphatase family protein [Clostridia bacterium]MBQ6494289.1 dual specificity protein phosphatase family protein [Erysipelotrichaceae bacterium]MBR0462612.1 dual specificity protein phosphatase family protein [Erysipelotrichaceae bacterium]